MFECIPAPGHTSPRRPTLGVYLRFILNVLRDDFESLARAASPTRLRSIQIPNQPSYRLFFSPSQPDFHLFLFAFTLDSTLL